MQLAHQGQVYTLKCSEVKLETQQTLLHFGSQNIMCLSKFRSNLNVPWGIASRKCALQCAFRACLLDIHRVAIPYPSPCLPRHSHRKERQRDREVQFVECYFQMKRLPGASWKGINTPHHITSIV